MPQGDEECVEGLINIIATFGLMKNHCFQNVRKIPRLELQTLLLQGTCLYS